MPTLRALIDASGMRRGAQEGRRAVADLSAATKKGERDLVDYGARLDVAGQRADTFKRSILSLIGGFSALAAARQAARTIIDFDSALIGVGKTTDITGTDLRAFGSEIINLSRQIPVAAAELAGIAQSAGQLGVRGSANLLLFTKTIAELGSASDLAGEEAAISLARILALTGETTEAIDKTSSVLVRLGNETRASESEIAAVATRVAQATTVFGLSSAEVITLSAAMRELGVEAEAGGTAIGRTFFAIDEALRRGGDAGAQLRQLVGDLGDFETVFRSDPDKALRLLLAGLGDVIRSGGDASLVMENLGLEGTRLVQVLLPLAVNIDQVNQRFALMDDELENTQARVVEAGRGFDSTRSKLALVRNEISAFLLGTEDSTGALDGLVDTTLDLTRALTGNEGAIKGNRTAIVGMADGLKALALILGTNALLGALGKVAVATRGLFALLTAHPIGALVTAVGALTLKYGGLGDRIKLTTELLDDQRQGIDSLIGGFENLKRASADALAGPAIDATAFDGITAGVQKLREEVSDPFVISIDAGLVDAPDLLPANEQERLAAQLVAGLDEAFAKARGRTPEFITADELVAIAGQVKETVDTVRAEHGEFGGQLADAILSDFTTALEQANLATDVRAKVDTALGAVEQAVAGATGGAGGTLNLTPEIDTTALDKLFEDLAFERTLIGATTAEREKAIAIREAERVVLAAYTDQNDDLSEILQRVREEIGALVDAEGDAAASVERLAAAQAEATQAGDLVAQTERRIAILGALAGALHETTQAEALAGAQFDARLLRAQAATAESEDEREALLEAAAALDQYGALLGTVANLEEGAATRRERLTEATRALDAAQRRLSDVNVEALTAGLDPLDRERVLLSLERERLAQLQVAAAADTARQAEADRYRQAIGLIDETAAALDRLEGIERIVTVANTAGRALTDNLTDAIFQAQTLEEAFNNVAEAIGRVVVEESLTRPIGEGFADLIKKGLTGVGGLPSLGDLFAKGGAQGAAGEPAKVQLADTTITGKPLAEALSPETAGAAAAAGAEFERQVATMNVTAATVNLVGGTGAQGVAGALGPAPGSPDFIGPVAPQAASPAAPGDQGAIQGGQTAATAAAGQGAAPGAGFSAASVLTGLAGAGLLAGGVATAASKESTAGKVAGGAAAVGGILTLLSLAFPALLPFGLLLGGGGLLGGLLTNAQGNVIAGGRVRRFAKGGITDGPEIFPMAEGMGVRGEAGAEAILPARSIAGTFGVEASMPGGRRGVVGLRRGPSGDLGIDLSRMRALALGGLNVGFEPAPIGSAFSPQSLQESQQVKGRRGRGRGGDRPNVTVVLQGVRDFDSFRRNGAHLRRSMAGLLRGRA